MTSLFKLGLILSILTCAALCAMGQTVPANPTDKPVKEARLNVDEVFDLNIDVRRISRENFEASTSVATDGDSGLNLQIGVGLTAGRIEVLMKNVQGRVRFRGTLDRILQMIDNRRLAPPPQ